MFVSIIITNIENFILNNLQHMHGTSFNWLSWRRGNLHLLNIEYNTFHILHHKNAIKKYAIGYCEGDKVLCRPKLNRMAVMFLKDNETFWTHLLINEFNQIFNNND